MELKHASGVEARFDSLCRSQGRRQKIFQGGGQRKKDRKLAKIPKYSTILASSGGATEKKTKK